MLVHPYQNTRVVVVEVQRWGYGIRLIPGNFLKDVAILELFLDLQRLDLLDMPLLRMVLRDLPLEVVRHRFLHLVYLYHQILSCGLRLFLLMEDQVVVMAGMLLMEIFIRVLLHAKRELSLWIWSIMDFSRVPIVHYFAWLRLRAGAVVIMDLL